MMSDTNVKYSSAVFFCRGLSVLLLLFAIVAGGDVPLRILTTLLQSGSG